MARKPISRTLQLKPVQFSPHQQGEEVTLVQLMRELRDRCPTVGSRIWEQMVSLADGTKIPQQCFFFNNYHDLDDQTLMFEVWSYEPGALPQTLTPDPNQQNAVIDERDGTDDSREMIQISHVLVFGKSAIIESTRGAGGIIFIQRYLNRLAKDHELGRKFSFYFTDAVSSALRGEIERGKGAVGFTLGLSESVPNAESELLGMLSGVKGYMPSNGMMTVEWKSKDTLPVDKVIAAYDEAQQQDEIDSVIIHLANGSSIRGLAKFKIKKTIEVEDVGGKHPNRAELSQKMLVYLEELCEPGANGKRILDEFGALADNEIFIPTARRAKERPGG
ncbi:hypothetical protein [Pseudomonas sp. DCB_BG]|uniref:hypothetical protein n=1 Tax=Pseudomonas sp. DCB_BG TaxID=2993595 RepID=UPI0022495317|nr:hypothetical protein [Pseudomonas sp. DCB_BG]MCX2709090.1 hypothetical protein [Pseudomonas sp. DCB_BG]